MNWKIIKLDTTDSTHEYIKHLDDSRVVVTADYQHAGHGQGNNKWESEKGKNLLFSVKTPVRDIPANRQFLLSMAGALALKDVLGQYAGGFSLKWPNDIYWHDSKISGTIIDTSISGKLISQCIYGIGINVNQRTFLSDAPNPVSLYNIIGKETDRDTILDHFLHHLDCRLNALADHLYDDITTEYKSHLYRRSGFHDYEDANGRFSASIKRILLKLSGESLAGEQKQGINVERLNQYAQQIKEIADMGVQIGIVIGGGNIFRGLTGAGKGFDRVKGDQMGMCATVINSLALSSALDAVGQKNRVLTAIRMEPIGEFYTKWKALESMNRGEVCIFSAGTGSPYFTTDTGSSLRGIEIEADVMLKGTRVDGIYTADPEKDPTAVKFQDITYADVIARNLKVMDITATAMCMQNDLPIYVFNMDIPGNLKKVMQGEEIGTLVHN